VNRVLSVVILAVLLATLIVLGISDTDIAVADTSVYDIETAITQHEASNSSATALIMIALTTASGEGG